MITITFALLFFALLAALLFRFALAQVDSTLGLARIVATAVIISIMTFIMTLAIWGLAATQNELAGLQPIRSTADFTAAADDDFILIEGRINERMPLKEESYVATIRLGRKTGGGVESNAYTQEPFSFDIDLSGEGTIAADANFTTLPRYPHNYYNWERTQDAFYIYYTVSRGTPVVMAGRPSNNGTTPAIHDTRFMYVGTAEQFAAEVAPTFQRWAYYGWGITAFGLILLLWLTTKTIPLWRKIGEDDSFTWQQLWDEAKRNAN